MRVPKLIPRANDAHKGTCGRVLIVGGSRGMTGAAALSGVAALNSGAGLVTVAVPDRCLETVAAHSLCFMTLPLEDDEKGRIDTAALETLRPYVEKATSIGIGPGLSQSKGVSYVVGQLFRRYAKCMVIDADALNSLADDPDGVMGSAGSRILTPHVGEFRRLVGKPDLSAEDCRAAAIELARERQLIVVLKGNRTLVTNGSEVYENETGNPGMATGGSGDVLTGVITALLGQGYSELDAAVLGVHVHGLAGDIACERFGEISMNANDIADSLSTAFQQLRQ